MPILTTLSTTLGHGLMLGLTDLIGDLRVSHPRHRFCITCNIYLLSVVLASSDDEGDAESEASQNAGKGPSTRAIRPIWPPLQPDLSGYHHQLAATDDHLIQRNKTAVREWQHHHVEWSWNDNIDPKSEAGLELKELGRGPATRDGSFLKNLKVGDMLTVWARSRFPGWTNHIQKVEVRVYWAL